MNQKEAQQLEKRIQHEAPYLKTSLEYVTGVGEGSWGVKLVVRSTGASPGVMENEEEWDSVKLYLLPPNP